MQDKIMINNDQKLHSNS